MQLRDSYFDEGISKCQGFSRNTLENGEKNMKEMLSHFQSGAAVGEEMSLVYVFLKLDLFKRSSGGNNDETMTRISHSYEEGRGDEAAGV